jgi:alkylation response protein AidB-like acyl-CoA dehydrogenase
MQHAEATMDLRLDEQTVRWRETARAYATEVVRPVAAALDARTDPEDCWSWDLVEEASARGLRQAPCSPEHGGDSTSFLTDVVMLEEIAAADVGASVVLAQHWKFLQMLREMATPDQLARWMPRLAGNPRALLAASFTEPQAGSDNMLPYDGPGAGLQTSARRAAGGWVVNGMKQFISNANRADMIICFARTDPDGPLASSVTAFLVAAETPGVSIGRVHDKCGERLANNSEIFYSDVFVPDADVLGTVGNGLRDVARLLRGSNMYAGACALGVARECYDRTVEWCRTRVQGGKPIIEHENVAAYLADMFLNVDVARTYVWRAAWQSIDADTYHPTLGAASKLVASEMAFDSARRALELWGGRGVMRENGIEKLLRDAAIWLHSDGTNILMRMKLMQHLRGAPAGGLWDAVVPTVRGGVTAAPEVPAAVPAAI